MKYTSQRGTRDILPDETPIWQGVENSCRKLFELYNYSEIRTPIFEATELFSRSIGNETDIVSKEMYTFTDKGNRSITLRPEATAPVVRACLQNNLISNDKLTKLYYVGPMFRYERPQAGRYRQFYQAGVEAFGSSDPALDAEIILLAQQIMDHLGLKDIDVNINSVGCPECRKEYAKTLKTYFSTHKDEMCEDCQKRFERNPLRILDCKVKKCQDQIEKAPAVLDTLCSECKKNFDEVLGRLEHLQIKYRINKRLVRGLDYYTRTTFEIVSKQLGSQNAVCGGGRYDNLVSEFGGKLTPACGFAIGLDRVVDLLRSQIPEPRFQQGKLLYIATIGDEAKKVGFDLLAKVRKKGRPAEMDYLDKSLKSQIKEADRMGAKQVLIIGEDEIKKNAYILKNMETGEQKEISFESLLGEL